MTPARFRSRAQHARLSQLRALLLMLLAGSALVMTVFCAGTHSDASATGMHTEPSVQHLAAAADEEPERHGDPHPVVGCAQGAVLRAVQPADESLHAVVAATVPEAEPIGLTAQREPPEADFGASAPARSGRATLVAICRWRI